MYLIIQFNLYFYFGFPFPCSRLTVFLLDSWYQIHYYLIMYFIFYNYSFLFIFYLISNKVVNSNIKKILFIAVLDFYFDRKFFLWIKTCKFYGHLLPLIYIISNCKTSFLHIYMYNDCFRDRNIFYKSYCTSMVLSYEYPGKL